MRRTIAVMGLSLAAFVGTPASAEEPAAGEELFVYTNADLERLDPIPTQDAPIAGGELGWDFVRDVLEQNYARLDADRRYQLNRVQIEAEARESERRARRPIYGLALAPYGRSNHRHGSHGGKPRAGNAGSRWPVPLHARTSLSRPKPSTPRPNPR